MFHTASYLSIIARVVSRILSTLAFSSFVVPIANAATNPGLLFNSNTFSSNTFNFNVGELKVGGSGCSNEDVFETRYPKSGRIGLYFPSYKAQATRSDRSDARKACSIALPIEVADDERIIVKDVSLVARVRLAPQTKAAVRMETFFSGTTGTPKIETLTATTDPINRLVKLNDPGVVLTGECGQAATLRLNTAANLTTDHPTNISQISTTSLRMTVKTEKCEVSQEL